jgi:hypothetical protein
LVQWLPPLSAVVLYIFATAKLPPVSIKNLHLPNTNTTINVRRCAYAYFVTKYERIKKYKKKIKKKKQYGLHLRVAFSDLTILKHWRTLNWRLWIWNALSCMGHEYTVNGFVQHEYIQFLWVKGHNLKHCFRKCYLFKIRTKLFIISYNILFYT